MLGQIGNSAIALDGNNIFSAELKFGTAGNTFTANAQFGTHGISIPEVNANFAGTLTAAGFSGNTVSGTFNGNAIETGSIDGKYYGSSELKSIGGTFNINGTSDNASGVFKAKKVFTTP